MLSKQFILTTTLLLTQSLVSAFDNNAKDNVAVYWGQDSSGSQDSLASYCKSADADIFLLSFADGFPNFDLNFADACSDSFDSGLLHCNTIADDIVTCQSLGKKVLLSLGGASGSYGFNDDSEARRFATTLWNTFGEGSGVQDRPFNSAVVDGFDFDIENNNNVGYAALVNKLRELFESGSKQYYISAAPQCPYPDASVGDLLANADVDFAFIQFYNNYCSVEGGSFNWDTWVNYAENVSPNSNIKLYLGLPGSRGSAGSGYVGSTRVLAETIEKISQSDNFGGFSFWDASTVFSNRIDGERYVHVVKQLLEDASSNDVNAIASVSSIAAASSDTSVSTQLTTTLEPTTTTTSMELTTTSYSELDTTTTVATPSTTDAPTPSTTTVADPSTTDAATSISSIQKDVDVPTARTRDATTATTTPVVATPAATTPAPTTMITQTTTAAAAAPTSTSAAHAIAVSLNAQYAAGQYNGQSTCTEGDLACTSDGSLAICNFGNWVTIQCAAGTTCYAYDYDDTVLTQCGFTDQKAQFM